MEGWEVDLNLEEKRAVLGPKQAKFGYSEQGAGVAGLGEREEGAPGTDGMTRATGWNLEGKAGWLDTVDCGWLPSLPPFHRHLLPTL